MSNKSYDQYCAIASALDVVGERWSLLVVRNLLLGPKRFSDLMRGLPGVSTNILTDRLKLLEGYDVLTTRYLPPPAASTVYELTPRGYALTDTLVALAHWGSERLAEPTPEQTFVPEGIGFMVLGIGYRADSPDRTIVCNVQVTADGYDHTFGLTFAPLGLSLSETPLPDAALHLRMPLATLPGLSSRHLKLSSLLTSRAVQVNGDAEAAGWLIEWVDGR